MSETSAAARRYALAVSGWVSESKRRSEVRETWIAAGREQELQLTRDAPSLFDRHRHAFVEPARQRPVARLGRERKVHDLVPDDRLQRVARIRGGRRADALREDRDVMSAGREAHDPDGSRACARIVFRNERDVDLWRYPEPRARERSRELLLIDLPHAVGHLSERGRCLDRQVDLAALRHQAGRADQQQDHRNNSADAVAWPADHLTSLTGGRSRPSGPSRAAGVPPSASRLPAFALRASARQAARRKSRFGSYPPRLRAPRFGVAGSAATGTGSGDKTRRASIDIAISNVMDRASRSRGEESLRSIFQAITGVGVLRRSGWSGRPRRERELLSPSHRCPSAGVPQSCSEGELISRFSEQFRGDAEGRSANRCLRNSRIGMNSARGGHELDSSALRRHTLLIRWRGRSCVTAWVTTEPDVIGLV